MKILILGGNGLLGQNLFFYLYKHTGFQIFATVKNDKNIDSIKSLDIKNNYHGGIDLCNENDIEDVILRVKPDIIINCAGVLSINNSQDILNAIKINTNLPHLLCAYSHKYNFRLIHISTDGVFDGLKGNYSENDQVIISDVYGMSKYLGEIIGERVLTIRTSIIGHNYYLDKGLVNWFLNASEPVNGYSKYIYSGLPTVEISRIIEKYILSNDTINGIYHIASKPIAKLEILKLLSTIYNKKIEIVPIGDPEINRTLNFSKFKKDTGYEPLPWEKLIHTMKNDYKDNINKFFK